MSLESQLRSATTFQALVIATDHANQDSLPLRYGLHFAKDARIDLTNIRFLYTDYQYSDRFHVEADFQDGGRKRVTGHFVIGNKRGVETPVVITVWSGDVKTEMRLSEVMIALRKRGVMTSEMLLSLHPLYADGKVNTAADLVEQLAKLLSADKLTAMRSELQEATAIADQAVAALEVATRRAEKAESVALEASYLVDDLSERNGSLSNRVGELEAEVKRYKAEQHAAARERSEATLSAPDTLVEVRERQMHRGSSCTILVLADGTQRHMKTSTFDQSGQVTGRAKALIGRRVRTSCWDPIGQPGKWSSQGYFRNIYAVE